MLTPEEQGYLTPQSNMKNLLQRDPPPLNLKRLQIRELQDTIQHSDMRRKSKPKVPTFMNPLIGIKEHQTAILHEGRGRDC
jgi:hypothetical protein